MKLSTLREQFQKLGGHMDETHWQQLGEIRAKCTRMYVVDADKDMGKAVSKKFKSFHNYKEGTKVIVFWEGHDGETGFECATLYIVKKYCRCSKCGGTGKYSTGMLNGKPTNAGRCFGCYGKGVQTYSRMLAHRAVQERLATQAR